MSLVCTLFFLFASDVDQAPDKTKKKGSLEAEAGV